MNVAVLGAGSIGSLIAAKISQYGVDNILIHARGEHGSAMALNGIEVTGQDSFLVKHDSMIISLDYPLMMKRIEELEKKVNEKS